MHHNSRKEEEEMIMNVDKIFISIVHNGEIHVDVVGEMDTVMDAVDNIMVIIIFDTMVYLFPRNSDRIVFHVSNTVVDRVEGVFVRISIIFNIIPMVDRNSNMVIIHVDPNSKSIIIYNINPIIYQVPYNNTHMDISIIRHLISILILTNPI